MNFLRMCAVSSYDCSVSSYDCEFDKAILLRLLHLEGA